MESGIRANGAALVNHGRPAPRDFQYRDSLIDSAAEESPFLAKFGRFAGSGYNVAALSGAATAQSGLFQERMAARPTGDEIKVTQGGYRIVEAATMQPADAKILDNHIAASQALQTLVAKNPDLGGKLMVMSEFELG
jgi:hypothetical protein